jgi:hypothetical protein
MRYPISPRVPLRYGLYGMVVSLFVSVSVIAQVELSMTVGFESRVTAGHYAPVVVTVSGYTGSDTGLLRVRQKVGNAWRGEAEMQMTLSQPVQTNGDYEGVIPIYDPVNPIVVELVTSAGSVLASEGVDLRGTLRPAPYPVLDRRLPRFDDRAALLDVASLPTTWWAFDSAESVWVGSALPEEVWAGLAQWVQAGGSLVVLTGSDYFRMDSTLLEAMIPLSDPWVAESEAGTSYLSGSVRDGVVMMTAEEGFPLLIEGRHGAGTVSLVTVRAGVLSAAQLTEIAENIPSAAILDVRESTEALLGEQRVRTLNSIAVLVLLPLSGGLIIAATLIGRRSGRLGWIVIGAGMVVLSVLSGLMSNPREHLIDVYIENTNIELIATSGVYLGSSGLYCLTDQPFGQAYREGVIPLESLPRTLSGADSYSVSTNGSRLEMRVLPGEVRTWHAYGSTPAAIHIHRVGDSIVRIGEFHPATFDGAWVVIDGWVYAILELREGMHDYSVAQDAGVRIGEFVSVSSDRMDDGSRLLLRDVRDQMALDSGVWLIAIAETEQVVVDSVTQKVRQRTVVISQATEGTDAI